MICFDPYRMDSLLGLAKYFADCSAFQLFCGQDLNFQLPTHHLRNQIETIVYCLTYIHWLLLGYIDDHWC